MTTTLPPAPPPGVADELIEVLAPLLANQRRKWAARCQAHGLSIVGFHALALLEEHGPIPMSRLADDLDVALPNATGIVSRLTDRGLVERGTDASDRRIVRVGLSPAGRALLSEMEAERLDRLRRLVSAMDTRQQQRLLRSIHDLVAAVERLGASTESS